MNKKNMRVYFLLAVAVSLNLGLWIYSNKLYPKWANVPPVPSKVSASMSFLGDPALAFRVSALALQNYGNIGGTQNLNKYNYETLAKWFWLMDSLDSHSSFVPHIAAYYYGAPQDPKKLPPLIHYLEGRGMKPGEHNWRWLAQAAYLTRHRLDDMKGALRIARELGSIYKPPMPIWTRNMESMLTADMGDKQAAYLLMLEILKSEGATMSASEYTSNINVICTAILKPEEAVNNSLCSKK